MERLRVSQIPVARRQRRLVLERAVENASGTIRHEWWAGTPQREALAAQHQSQALGSSA